MITKEQLEQANEMIKKIPFKGKGYALVASRISAFRAICPRGRINTEILSMENGEVTMKTTIYDDDDRELSNGYAQEKEGSSYINKTSFIENCETSAIGRALGNLGIGSDENIASAEELANAVLNQGEKEKSSPKKDAKKAPHRKDTPEEARLNDEMRASVDPDLLPDPKRTPEYRAEKIRAKIAEKGQDEAKLMENAKVKDWLELTDAKFVSLMGWLERK